MHMTPLKQYQNNNHFFGEPSKCTKLLGKRLNTDNNFTVRHKARKRHAENKVKSSEYKSLTSLKLDFFSFALRN